MIPPPAGRSDMPTEFRLNRCERGGWWQAVAKGPTRRTSACGGLQQVVG